VAIDKRILENASILTVSHIAAQLANFGFVIVFARTFGASLLGEYSFALSLGGILAVITSLGSRQLILRSASEDPRQWNTLIGILLPVQLLLSLLAWVLVFTIVWAKQIPKDALWIVTSVCLFSLFTPLIGSIAAAFSARERMSFLALAESLRSIAILVLGSIVIWIGMPAGAVIAVMPCTAVAAATILYRLAQREYGVPTFRFDTAELLLLLKRTLPFLGIALSNVLFIRSGVLMLRGFGGAEAVGLFSAAERIVGAAVLLVTMLGNAMFPQLVRLWSSDRARFEKLAQQGQRLILLVTLPGATLLVIFSGDLLPLLFGVDYVMSINVLHIVAWALVFRGVSNVHAFIALAQLRQRDVVVSKLAGLTMLASACVLFVPAYAALGLAVSVVVADVVVFSLLAWRVGNMVLLSSLGTNAVRISVACLLGRQHSCFTATTCGSALSPYCSSVSLASGCAAR
jgi:O-antigen/teichoic acid export membrane protein